MELGKVMLDVLTRDCKTPQEVEKLYSQMLQHMINRSLEAEMQAHLVHASSTVGLAATCAAARAARWCRAPWARWRSRPHVAARARSNRSW